MRIVLLVNAGHSDLRVVSSSAGGAVAWDLPRRNSRAWHEALRVASARWTFVPEARHGRRDPLERLPSSGPIHIHLPKIEPLLDWIVREGHELVASLVFATRRSGRQDEPIGLGAVLSRRLAEAAAQGVPPWRDTSAFTGVAAGGRAAWVDYLQGDEELERDGPAAEQILPAAVRRIDRAVAAVVDEVETDGELPLVLVGPLGGIGRIGDLLQAVARLRFGQEQVLVGLPPLSWRPGATGFVTGLSSTPSTVLQYRLRATAATLVRRGNFAGAWRVVEWAAEAIDGFWVDALRAVGDGLLGHHVEAGLPPAGALASREEDGRQLLDWWFGASHERPTFRRAAALRVEQALAVRDIQDAAVGVARFIDSVALDLFGSSREVRLKQTLSSADVSPPLPAAWAEHRCSFKLLGAPNRLGARYRFWVDVHPSSTFWSFLEERSGRPEVVRCLAGFVDAFRTRDSAGWAPAEYRNAAIHRALGSGRLQEADRAFSAAGLWNLGAEPGRRFLASERVESLVGRWKPNGSVRAAYQDLQNWLVAVLHGAS